MKERPGAIDRHRMAFLTLTAAHKYLKQYKALLCTKFVHLSIKRATPRGKRTANDQKQPCFRHSRAQHQDTTPDSRVKSKKAQAPECLSLNA